MSGWWPIPGGTVSKQLAAITKQLTAIQDQQATILRELTKIMTEQAGFDADLSALTNFFSDLSAQLTNIQSQLAQRGITDISGLDTLVQQAQSLQPTVDALGSGSTPPAPPAPSGT